MSDFEFGTHAVEDKLEAYHQLGELKIGESALMEGQVVTVDDVVALGDGRVHVKASFPGGLIDAYYP